MKASQWLSLSISLHIALVATRPAPGVSRAEVAAQASDSARYAAADAASAIALSRNAEGIAGWGEDQAA